MQKLYLKEKEVDAKLLFFALKVHGNNINSTVNSQILAT